MNTARGGGCTLIEAQSTLKEVLQVPVGSMVKLLQGWAPDKIVTVECPLLQFTCRKVLAGSVSIYGIMKLQLKPADVHSSEHTV